MALIESESGVAGQDALRISEATFKDYFELLKPRVMSLVIFTAFAGLVMAPGHINPVIGFIAILCIAVGAGASGALNMCYDADIDAVMTRTASRPIPSGRILPGVGTQTRIELARYGPQAGVRGAALLAGQELEREGLPLRAETTKES